MIKSILKFVLSLKCLSDLYHNMQIKIHHWSFQHLTLNVTISIKIAKIDQNSISIKIAKIASHNNLLIKSDDWFLVFLFQAETRYFLLKTFTHWRDYIPMRLNRSLILFNLSYHLVGKKIVIDSWLISLNKEKKSQGSNIALFCREIFLNIMKNDKNNITQSKHNRYWVPSN